MSVNNLINKIVEDARKQETAILEKSKEEASKILLASEKKIEKMISDNKEKAVVEGNAMKDRTIQSAILQVRNKKLSAKQEMLDKVFCEAIARLESLDNEEFEKFFITSVRNSGFTGNGEVIVNSKRENAISSETIKKLNEELGLELSLGKPSDIDDGFMLKRDNVCRNFTFKAIMEFLKGDLRTVVAKELF